MQLQQTVTGLDTYTAVPLQRALVICWQSLAWLQVPAALMQSQWQLLEFSPHTNLFMLTCWDDTAAVGLRGCALLLQPLQTAA